MSLWKKFLSCFCAAALLLSCASLAASADNSHYTVACIGDSLTYGTGSSDPATKSWPALLEQQNGDLVLHTENFGVYGRTVSYGNSYSYVDTDSYQSSLDADADIYLVMLGSNDCRFPLSDEYFENCYRSLLESYLSLEQAPTVVVILPPEMYYEFPYSYLNREIYHVRDMEKSIAEEYGLDIIDLSILSQGMEKYCLDGGHYSDEGYAIFANYIYRCLSNIL